MARMAPQTPLEACGTPSELHTATASVHWLLREAVALHQLCVSRLSEAAARPLPVTLRRVSVAGVLIYHRLSPAGITAQLAAVFLASQVSSRGVPITTVPSQRQQRAQHRRLKRQHVTFGDD